MKKIEKIPYWATLLGIILMIITLFLPYTSATENYSKELNAYGGKAVYETLGTVAEDLVDISLVEYANLYNNLSEHIWGSADEGVLYIILILAIGILSVIALIFAIFRKPIATIIFTLLSLGVYLLQRLDYVDRGVVPSDNYNWGIGYYIYYVAVAIVIVGSIGVLINKIKGKKENS